MKEIVIVDAMVLFSARQISPVTSVRAMLRTAEAVKWRCSPEAGGFIVRDAEGMIVAQHAEQQQAIVLALTRAIASQQSVRIIESKPVAEAA